MAVARQYTTAAPAETATGSRTRLVLAEGDVVSGPTVSLSVILLGVVTVLVGAWGAAAPFVGPEFGFVADRYGAWQWSQTSVLLGLLPGAVALVCGLWVLAAAARPSYGRRPDLWLLGLISAACGAWFVVGQYAWRALGNRAFIVPSGPTHFMWKELCFAVGPGVILVLCGALFMGWAVRRQLAVVAERYPQAAAPAGVTSTGQVVGEPVPPVASAATPGSTMAPPATAGVRPVAEHPTAVVRPPVGGDPGVVTTAPAHAAEGDPVVERPATVAPTGQALDAMGRPLAPTGRALAPTGRPLAPTGRPLA